MRILKKAWEAQPHPDLAHAFAEIEPNESAKDRVKRFEQLLRLKPDHDETRLVKAELLIVAEDFPEARRALGDLVERAPDARALTLMAAIEKGQGGPDAMVQGWLTKALSAPRGPQWVCDNCNHIHAEWAPTCEHCASFDTLTWKRPETPGLSSAASAAMLPLLTGVAAGAAAQTPVVVDPEIVDVAEEPLMDERIEDQEKPAETAK